MELVRINYVNGDVTFNAINKIAIKRFAKRVVPAGSTYKIRGRVFMFSDIRVFPSYMQTGKNDPIERSKREMIADNIRCVLDYVN